MIRRRTVATLGAGAAILLSLVPSTTLTRARAYRAYPGLSFFHLPASVVGPSAPYGGEGGGASTDHSGLGDCSTAPSTPSAASHSCYGYFYGVAAAVPSRSHDGPYSFYEVDIFPSVGHAQVANSTTRDTLAAGFAPCTETYRWVTRRVLASLYPRAVAFVRAVPTTS